LKCKIKYTKHMWESIEDRGFSPAEVRNTITLGSKRQQIDVLTGEVKTVARHGVCEVVYKQKPCRVILITVQILRPADK